MNTNKTENEAQSDFLKIFFEENQEVDSNADRGNTLSLFDKGPPDETDMQENASSLGDWTALKDKFEEDSGIVGDWINK